MFFYRKEWEEDSFIKQGKQSNKIDAGALTQCLDEQCIEALSWGMPYELFWYGKLDAFYLYREKAINEQRRKQEEIDSIAWLEGKYTEKALLSVYHMFNCFTGANPQKIPYPNKPLLMQQQEDEMKTEEDKNMLLYKKLKAWSVGVKPKE